MSYEERIFGSTTKLNSHYKWDPVLCGKMTICSVEAVFFCVTTFGERTLRDTGTDTPSMSFK